ncbi:MAG: TIGR03086 family metal-binding protein [Acidimicrobiales bacterium]
MKTHSRIQDLSIPGGAYLPGEDPREIFARAVATGASVVAGVGPDQLDGETGCPEYDVRALLGHLLLVLERVAIIGRAGDPMAMETREPAPAVADDGWGAAWADAAIDVAEAWADGASLDRVVILPWSQESGAGTLAGYLNEVTVHTWDLAVATGQRPEWDPRVVELAFDAIRRNLPGEGRAAMFEAGRQQMPEAMGDWADPFAEAVEVAAGAPLIDRLVAWNGRRP